MMHPTLTSVMMSHSDNVRAMDVTALLADVNVHCHYDSSL